MSFSRLLSHVSVGADPTPKPLKKDINYVRPLASGAIYAGGMYGVRKLVSEPNATLLSKQTLMDGGIQAASSLVSDQLQSTIHEYAPSIVVKTGSMTKPLTTAALNLGANLVMKAKSMPDFSDMALMFGISAVADTAADHIITM